MSEEFDELDLLAYADGRVTGDRAARIKAYLAERPELAQRVRDFAQQDRELHAQYDHHLDDPLPDRLAQLFDEPSAERPRARLKTSLAQAAAAAVLMAVTGGAGWWLGQSADAGGDRGFANAAAERFILAAPLSDSEIAGAQRMASGQPTLQRFSDRISLELRAPDLSAQGYRLVDKRRVQLDDGQSGIALRYAGAQGDQVQVFLKSRWRERVQDVRTERKNDVTVTYWNDGPIVVAVASPSDDGPAGQELADEVQKAFGRAPKGKPKSPDATIPTLEPYSGPQPQRQEASTPTSGDGTAGQPSDIQP